MIFRNQFGAGPAQITDVWQVMELPEDSLIIDKAGKVWRKTLKNPHYGGDMYRLGKIALGYICGAKYFSKFLPATIIHVPKHDLCENACQFALDTGVPGSCQGVCSYLCVDEFPE